MISRQIFGIRRGKPGNVSANPRASSSSLYPGKFNPWISKVTEHTPVLTSTGRPVTCGERQIPDTVLTPRFQTGPSAGNSFDPKEGRFSKNYGAAQQRLQISELHFDKFLTPTTFACWKIRFKTEVCTCVRNFLRKRCNGSKKWSWLIQWMIRNLRVLTKELIVQTFELLDARIASVLNKIIQNTRSKKKVSLEDMKAHTEDRFLRGRQIACLIYGYFRVTGANDSDENYADLFTVALRNDNVQEFDAKWEEILWSITQIPSDDILEKWYK